MHLRRIACILLGAWLAGTLVIGWVATTNFAAADHVLAAPPPEVQQAMAPLNSNAARMVLRYLVAVENAGCFLSWERTEFALLILIGAALAGDRRTRRLAAIPAGLILAVAFQHFRITPEIIWLGQYMVRGIATQAQRDQFAAMHRIYGVTEVVKLLLGVVLGAWLVLLKTRRRGHRSSTEDPSDRTFDRRYAT